MTSSTTPPSTLWPAWRAALARVRRLALARIYEALMHGIGRPGDDVMSAAATVPRPHVLRVILEHELWKHGSPAAEGGALDAAGSSESALAQLLVDAGWPAWRVRRLRSLYWRECWVDAGAIGNLHLTPVMWVLRLGAGNNRARAVAQGAAEALRGDPGGHPHLDEIRRVLSDPPRPRAIVLRESGPERIVEDGNHFVIATLLQAGLGESVAPIRVLIGERECSRQRACRRPTDPRLKEIN